MLRSEPGFVCVGVAADGAETLQALPRAKPDVVLLDRRLGDEDGLWLCQELRAEPGAPQVVMYTAEPDGQLEDLARAAGACCVVEKTRPIDTLFDALRLAVRTDTGSSSAGRSAVA